MPTKKNDSFADVEDPSVIREEILMPSSLETIDLAMYDFVDNLLDIYSTTNKGFKKVPVLWVSG